MQLAPASQTQQAQAQQRQGGLAMMGQLAQSMPQHEEQYFDDMDNSDIVGVIKIKDGLFICDEVGAQVSLSPHSVLSFSHLN